MTGNSATEQGGGIYSSAVGSLSVVRTSISSNRASSGGGIYSLGVNASIVDSTLSGNTATGQGGGLFSQNQSLVVNNSTFSGNTANAIGGGIYVQPLESATAQILHSTVTANRAAGGGVFIAAGPGTVYLDHTIIARNTRFVGSQPDDISGRVTARYSLIDVNTVSIIVNNGGNQIGNLDAPVDPRLGPLADNGGPTLTHALSFDSPAIDAGDPGFVAGASGPLNDQRGAPFDRVDDGKGIGARIDIGAYEVQSGSISGRKWNDFGRRRAVGPVGRATVSRLAHLFRLQQQ